MMPQPSTTRREGKALRSYRVPATRWVVDLQRAYPARLPLDIVPTGVSSGDMAKTAAARVVEGSKKQ